MCRLFAAALIFTAMSGHPLRAASGTQTAPTPAGPAVKAQDTRGTPDERADALAAQMTLEEKIQLLGGDKTGFATQAIPRLEIPPFRMSDGPQGVRNPDPPADGIAYPCG